MKRLGGLRRLGRGVILAALLPTAAEAFVVDATTAANTVFTVDWLLAAGETDPNSNTNNTGYDISGTATFEYLSSSANLDGSGTIDFLLTLTNTTVANDKEIGLYKFAFGTNPDATVGLFNNITASVDDSNKVTSVTDTADPKTPSPNLPNAAIIDIQTSTLTGAKRTLQAGEFDVFELSLDFAALDLASGVTFSPFDVWYQSNPDSFQFSAGPPSAPGPGIPLPGTLLLLAAGLLGLRRHLHSAA